MTRDFAPTTRVTVANPTATTERLRDRTGTVVIRSLYSVVVEMDAPVPVGIRCDATDARLVVCWPDELAPITEAAPVASVAA